MSKRIKKNSVSYFKRECDKAMSELVRSIGRCQKCGTTVGLAHAHVIPRTNFALRYDPINSLCLCFFCHIYWAHKNPIEFTLWFQEKFPDRYTYLVEYRNQIKKRTIDDWKTLLTDIRERNISKLHYS